MAVVLSVSTRPIIRARTGLVMELRLFFPTRKYRFTLKILTRQGTASINNYSSLLELLDHTPFGAALMIVMNGTDGFLKNIE